MNPILSRNLFLVKEQISVMRAENNFDIYDPNDGSLLIICREEGLNFFTKLLRFTDSKTSTPFNLVLRNPNDGRQIVRVNRGWVLFLSKVTVHDENDNPIGFFQQKLFSIGGAFDLFDMSGQLACTLKGSWTGWEFRFASADGQELAMVTKKWAGIGKELFTTADNYIISVSDHVRPNDPVRQLILAAVMCIDMVLKEK